MRDLTRWLFSPWVLGGALVISLLLLAVVLGVIWFTRPGRQPVAASTAVLNVVALATSTPIPPTPTPTQPVTPTPTLDPNIPPPPEPGTFGIGGYVQISGTGGDGLRLRVDPGLQTEVRMLGAESEVFIIRDGPVEVDGYTWWYLVGPFDETRRGWAVANYLTVVQQP